MTRTFWRQNIQSTSLEVLRPFYFLDPILQSDGSLMGSAYYFLYISLCFGLNRALMNLTLLLQHHLQYRRMTIRLKDFFKFDNFLISEFGQLGKDSYVSGLHPRRRLHRGYRLLPSLSKQVYILQFYDCQLAGFVIFLRL
jgi:hypothetical protein